MADYVFQIGTPEQYGRIVGMPMGTTFELSTLLFLPKKENAISVLRFLNLHVPSALRLIR